MFLLLQSICSCLGRNQKQLKMMACAEVYFIYTLFICEGDEANE